MMLIQRADSISETLIEWTSKNNLDKEYTLTDANKHGGSVSWEIGKFNT